MRSHAATKDLDILIGTDAANGKAIYTALAKFGGPIEGLSAKDFIEPDNFFRMGAPPVMVGIMPRISGFEFDLPRGLAGCKTLGRSSAGFD